MSTDDRAEVRRISALLARFGVHVGTRYVARRNELARAIVSTGRSALVTVDSLDWRRQLAREQGRSSLGAALAEFLEDPDWPETMAGRGEESRPSARNSMADDPLLQAHAAEARCRGMDLPDYLRELEGDRLALAIIHEERRWEDAPPLVGGSEALERLIDDRLRRVPVDGCSTWADLKELRERRQNEALARWRARHAAHAASAAAARPAAPATPAPAPAMRRRKAR